MTKTIGHVNYYLNNGVYIVGNGNEKSGLSPTNFKGEIVILPSIDSIEITEISAYAFAYTSITKVTILAKIKTINRASFHACQKLSYINIPSTVTYIGLNGINLGDNYNAINRPITVEFNSGRTEQITLAERAISRRVNYKIIYPSNILPICETNAMETVTTADICAPEEFSFCQFTTTKDQTKCPEPLFDSNNERKSRRLRKKVNTDRFLKSAFIIVIRRSDSIDNDEQNKKAKAKTNGLLKTIKRIVKKILRKK